MTNESDKMHVRSVVTDLLDFLIKESIYYRANSENINADNRFVAWQLEWDNGKIHIP